MRGIFSLRAHHARFLRKLHAFFRTSTNLSLARSKSVSSEIASRAFFFWLRFRRSEAYESVVTPDLDTLANFAAEPVDRSWHPRSVS